MGVKLLIGALVGWVVAILAIMLIFKLDEVNSWTIFLALAPGSIIGILVVYITNKDNKNGSQTKIEISNPVADRKDENKKTVSEQLTEIKQLYDGGILSEEEFIKLKSNVLKNL